jgi:hypothetical protein
MVTFNQRVRVRSILETKKEERVRVVEGEGKRKKKEEMSR